MAGNAKAIQTALEDLLGGTKNLPSHYQDFEQLTRDLVRRLASQLVMVDRETWNEITRPKGPNNLEASTLRYKNFNDNVEQSLKRESVPPIQYARPKM